MRDNVLKDKYYKTNEVLNILEPKILELIKDKMAKPNKTIEEHTMDLLQNLALLKELNYINEKEIYDLVEKACVYHDLGKLNSEFQKRVTAKKKIFFDSEKEVGHNILSLSFINNEVFDKKEDYYKVSAAVLNHHNHCDNFEEMTAKDNLVKELLQDLPTYKVKRSLKSKISQMIEDNEAIKIKGYLHKCDYSASAELVAEYPNDFLEESLDNLLRDWQEQTPEAQWNELQKYCVENKNENIIAIAQTGMGKTEAGLLWIGDNKGFFVLPIRTAINAIYDRVKDGIIKSEKLEERLAILHSSALEYYINNLNNDDKKEENNKNENNEDKEEIDLIQYHKMGKQLSIPLNISTMDQIFDFVYKYPGYELKATTLSYSKVVIDEIQAYGADLLAYLICGLEKIVELGGKVAILTATLPPFVKELLKNNINFKERETGFTNDLKRHNLKIIEERINSDDIYIKYKENKEKNICNKILVVCNTIKEAQIVYEELKEKEDIPKEELNILHSKFIRKDRAEKEEKIIDFGKTYEPKSKIIDKQNGIWISTSIVEASLDIDFDYLYTELLDLSSLFQRLGRCNRKGKKDSSNYNCYIYTEINNEYLTNGSKGFIDSTLYQLSKEAIINIDGQVNEVEKIAIIDKTLTTENLKSSDYMKEYRKIYNQIKELPPYEFKKEEVKLRNIDSVDIIPNKVYENYFEEINELSEILKNEKLTIDEKTRLRDKLMKYTVSVSKFDFENYKRGLQSGKAIPYGKIYLSRNKKDYIQVIECIYEDAGFKRVNYKEAIREPNIW